MNVLIIGASGAIGRAVTEQLLGHDDIEQIHATFNRHDPRAWTQDKLTWHRLNVQLEEDFAHLAQSLDNIDWIINCVGMLYTEKCMPEKNCRQFDCDYFQTLFEVNTRPTMLIAKYFTPQLKQSSQPKLLTLSARVGSISDNQLGGWYSYRASKAALNMLLKTLSIEWQRSLKNSTVIAFHPGTTDSELSKPFQKNVPVEKLFSADKVATDLINALQTIPTEQSGCFIDFDRKIITW